MKTIIINNIETYYLISEDGRVYNLKTKRYLKGHLENTGYISVNLNIDNKKKNYALHRLVAQTFLENPDNLPIVNHKDGNKLNNNVDNLEWVTQSQNRVHAIETKISQLAKGKREKIEVINKKDWKRYGNTSYYVSKDGRVWNSKTKILLKQTPNSSGYIRYTLRINNSNISKQAHIMVIETWSDIKILSGQVINHIDGNKTNNDISNLEVVSKQENALHACYTLNKNIKAVIRLSDNQEYPSISKAARENNVTPGAITYALKNSTKCCNSYWQYK